MDLKLKALDKSRTQSEYDCAFLHNFNNMRIQSFKFMDAVAKEETNAKFDRIACCLQEVVFNNPVFMKRLSATISEGNRDVHQFISNLFSIYLPILYFVGGGITNASTQACKANSTALLEQAQKVFYEKGCKEYCSQLGPKAEITLIDIARNGFTRSHFAEVKAMYEQAQAMLPRRDI